MKNLLCHSISPYRVVLVALGLLLGGFASGNDEQSQSEPVMGYVKLNCKGEGQQFESKILMLQSDDPIYWSWHIVGSKRKCENIHENMEEMVIVGTRLPSVNFNSASFSGLPRSRFTMHVMGSLKRWSDEAWVDAMNETQACWRQKARAEGVEFLAQDFLINVNWELAGQGETEFNRDDMSFESIEINPTVIGNEAYRHKHYFYTDLVYTLIHESIHAERLVEGSYALHPVDGGFDIVRDEREVQKLAFNRYFDIYGKKPPFKYMSDGQFTRKVKKYDRLRRELQQLLDENKPAKNKKRIDSKKLEIEAEVAKLNQGVKNGDYNWKNDKIETC